MYIVQIAAALKAGETGKVRALTANAIEEGWEPEQILNEALIPAMDEVGEQFKGSEIFIPEVLKASRALHGGIRMLQSKFSDQRPEKKPTRVLIGTVAGDLHDIGKNLVSMFLDAQGYEVINLGIDVPTEEFVWAVRKHKPQVLAMSALLTTTMGSMQDTIDELTKAGLRERIKVLVGGGPVTDVFAVEIGADGYAYDAKGAVDWINQYYLI